MRKVTVPNSVFAIIRVTLVCSIAAVSLITMKFAMSTPSADWTFLHVNDSHLGTPRSYRFRPAINRRWQAIKQQMASTSADLLLHGGDLTRDGATHDFELTQARDDLETLPFPVFVIPGNMDVGNKHAFQVGAKTKWDERGLGWHDPDLNMTEGRLKLFASYFGPCHWTRMYRNVRFTGMYAAVAGTGLPEEAQFWSLLERLPHLPRAQHHVAMMHYWPFMEDPEEPDWDLTQPDEYDNWYFSINPPHRQRMWRALQAAGVEILFCGHVHTGRPAQTVDGIRILRTPAAGNTPQLQDRWHNAECRFGFHSCRVTTAAEIEVTFVPGTDQCDEFDSYGPMGHPAVEARDYSAAKETPPLSPDGHV